MLVMVGNHSSLRFGHLATKYPGRVGHLYSPGGERGPYDFVPYALDNGAFACWSTGRPWVEGEWLNLIRWAALSGIPPLWAVVPDVVADRDGTLARWSRYVGVVRGMGWRAAFAVQDGMVFGDVPADADVLFLGGTTEWKEAAVRPWCARFPGRVHVARVNFWSRLSLAYHAGAASVDGTGWFRRGARAGGKGNSTDQLAELEKFLRETT